MQIYPNRKGDGEPKLYWHKYTKMYAGLCARTWARRSVYAVKRNLLRVKSEPLAESISHNYETRASFKYVYYHNLEKSLELLSKAHRFSNSEEDREVIRDKLKQAIMVLKENEKTSKDQ